MRLRTLPLFLSTILVISSSLLAKEVKIHGYVTDMQSPLNFQIDEYKITSDKSLVLDFERENEQDVVDFRPEDIRIGTELEIKGDYDEKTGELHAKSIKVFLEDAKYVKRMALLRSVPQLTKTDEGWSGSVNTDGERVTITPQTKLSLHRNKSQRKAAKEKGLNDDEEQPFDATTALDLDTFVYYEGTIRPDGSILASKAWFMHNEREDGEVKLWREVTPKEKDPQYDSFKAGELKIANTKDKTLPNKDVQEYIDRLGKSLIPAHQRQLAPNDPLYIPFHFYVVEDKDFNAAAYPDGAVVVHTGVFDTVENEAQLASVLSHEITHAIEKHTWREHEYHKKALMALRIGGIVGAGFGGRSVAELAQMIEAGIRNGYARSLENQADREGLEWMMEAGYDPREAPRVWKVVSKKYGDHSTNFFWSNHDNNTTRRSYLMAELRNNYPELDYSKFKTDSDEFHRMAEAVKITMQHKK